MLTIPAIDLRGGRVVRLLHGRFDAETHYGDDPLAQAEAFAAAGAPWIHVVDLDGAKDGAARQTEAIAALTGVARIQAGGGVRCRADVDRLIAGGVARVVVGSAAVADPAEVRRWVADLGPDALTIALDVSTAGADAEPIVLSRGWQDDSGVTLWAALDSLGDAARHILVTDVARDGALTGPNVALIAEIVRRRPDVALQASGGVRDAADLAELAATGAAAAIVGRALYEGKLSLC